MTLYADLFRYGDLFLNLFRRELSVKYRGSVLGLGWTLVLPLVLMGVYTIVFSVLLKAVDIDHYPLFLLSGLVTWVFFQGAIQSSCTSLLGQASLVKQVRFPRQLLPFAVVATNAVTLFVMLAVLIPVNLIFLPETRSTFWAGIPLVLPLVALAGSLALVLASVTVIFRDVEHLADGGAPALVLPDAGLLHARPAGDRQPSGARQFHPLRKSRGPLRPGDSRPALLRRASAAGDVVYVFVVAIVALVVAALVFRRVDDQLAAQL